MSLPDPEETRKRLGDYRVTPRPTYFSAVTNSNVEISADFETYLINLDNQAKQQLITRLRKSMDACVGNLDRDGLEAQAADFEARSIGAVRDELNQDVSDFTKFSASAFTGTDQPEAEQILSTISYALGPKIFQRDQAVNSVGYSVRAYGEFQAGSSNNNRKAQIRSWIQVIVSYLT